MITTATDTPIIMAKGDDDDDDGELVWSGETPITQSSEVNESSIVGQSESMSRVTPFTPTDVIVCTHWFISFTISSASVTEAGTCKFIIARYTTVFLNSPWDPRQLKVSSMILLEVNAHEQSINTCSTISALMSLCFCCLLISYIWYTWKYHLKGNSYLVNTIVNRS